MASSRVQHPRTARAVLKQLRQMYGTPEQPEQAEPVEQLVLAILARNESMGKAQETLQKLKSYYVDFNELRVAARGELARQLEADIGDASGKARQILSVLKGVFDRENKFDLEFLRSKSKREVEKYFSGIEEADSYLVCSVILNCCGSQAFPLDEKMLEACGELKLAEGEVTVEGMQAFLERQLKAAQTYTFCYLLKQYSVKEAAPKARKDKKKKAASKKDAGKKKAATVKKTAKKKKSAARKK